MQREYSIESEYEYKANTVPVKSLDTKMLLQMIFKIQNNLKVYVSND